MFFSKICITVDNFKQATIGNFKFIYFTVKFKWGIKLIIMRSDL